MLQPDIDSATALHITAAEYLWQVADAQFSLLKVMGLNDLISDVAVLPHILWTLILKLADG